MTMFLVRDDDPNATTDPEVIERTYAPLLDAGVPIVFATIPEVRLDTRAPDGARERFLHPGSPDTSACQRMLGDTPFATWLRAHASQVDVFLHGLSHERVRGGTEFGALTQAEALDRIDEGLRVLGAAIDRQPLGFVAPWDALSAGALRACAMRFGLVSTGWVDRTRLPMSAWPAHVVERVTRREALRVGRTWMLRHRGGRIDGKTRAEDVPAIVDTLGSGADVAVIVLHHWMFSSHEPHPAVVALARALRNREVGNLRAAIHSLEARPVWRAA
jgi:hypothetical protein